MNSKLKVFISYAREEEALKEELIKFMVVLERSGKIEVWHDRMIDPGIEWNHEIKKELLSADIIILLISQAFIKSKFISENELLIALERHEKHETRVIPIIAKPCTWKSIGIKHLNVLPKDGKPINKYRDKDEVLTQIAEKIEKVVDELINEEKLKVNTFVNSVINKKYANIFLSVASPYNGIQLAYVQSLKSLFNLYKFNLVTLESVEWNDEDPIEPISSLMQTCFGCIVLLIERYFIENGKIKRGSKQESFISGKAMTTPWCQIEATLAWTKKLPLLILKDKNVHIDGVFDEQIKKFQQVKIDIENFDEWKGDDKKYILNMYLDLVKARMK